MASRGCTNGYVHVMFLEAGIEVEGPGVKEVRRQYTRVLTVALAGAVAVVASAVQAADPGLAVRPSQDADLYSDSRVSV